MNLDDLVSHAVARLEAAGVRDEALATRHAARSIGPIRRPLRLVPTGRAWRLGTLLITRDGDLLVTGGVTRAVVPRDFAANKSADEEARRQLQRAAARGPFAPGESVNIDATPALGSAVVVREGIPLVILGTAEVRLDDYLDERIRAVTSPDWD